MKPMMNDMDAVNEGLNEINAVLPLTEQDDKVFYLVIFTQMWETYKGRYHKSTGGNDYVVLLGTGMEVLQMGGKYIKSIVNKARATIESDPNEGADEDYEIDHERILDWEIMGESKIPDLFYSTTLDTLQLVA